MMLLLMLDESGYPCMGRVLNGIKTAQELGGQQLRNRVNFNYVQKINITNTVGRYVKSAFFLPGKKTIVC